MSLNWEQLNVYSVQSFVLASFTMGPLEIKQGLVAPLQHSHNAFHYHFKVLMLLHYGSVILKKQNRDGFEL